MKLVRGYMKGGCFLHMSSYIPVLLYSVSISTCSRVLTVAGLALLRGESDLAIGKGFCIYGVQLLRYKQ